MSMVKLPESGEATLRMNNNVWRSTTEASSNVTSVGARDEEDGSHHRGRTFQKSISLHEVMDEQLAAKLQEEEDELIARQHIGWCFMEVPSENSNEYDIMNVYEEHISMEEVEDDPDFAFALELQAQEAEEYDRLRRQEAASIERIRVIQRDLPQSQEIRDLLTNRRYGHRQIHQRLPPSPRDTLEDYDDEDDVYDTLSSLHFDDPRPSRAQSRNLSHRLDRPSSRPNERNSSIPAVSALHIQTKGTTEDTILSTICSPSTSVTQSSPRSCSSSPQNTKTY